jgi:hypothetical protein
VQVIDGPLVEYFESCRDDLRRQGFHVLVLALVREGDAPLFYDDLVRYWDSINDVTGSHVVFAVAGGQAAEKLGKGSVHGAGYYTEEMAVAERNTFGIEQLRQMAGSRRNVAAHLQNIAEANTQQISMLCDHLGVQEIDLPCLHMTHLRTVQSLVLPLASLPGATIYTICKAIVSHLQPSFRAFVKSARVEENAQLIKLQHNRKDIHCKIQAARGELGSLDACLAPPKERMELERQAAYLRNASLSRPEIVPVEIEEVIGICVNPDRTREDQRRARTLVKQLALIPRISKRANRMIDAAFAPESLSYGLDEVQCLNHEKRRLALTSEIASLELDSGELIERESALKAQIEKIRDKNQAPALTMIEESFFSLPTIGVEVSRPDKWDVFLSYSAEDRDFAIQVFDGLRSTSRVFMDWFCLLPGQDWQRLIPTIQRYCRYTVALIGRRSSTATFQLSETQRAINLMRDGTHRILPVYLDVDIEAPFGLEHVHHIYWSSCPGGDPIATLRKSILV